ncbi:MAG: helix-turn-helix domain-containing protein [Actinomycetota bacterium]|nr:helix-turn-helix domain-containing protein [Actinomycetota bacterium]
MSDEAPEQEPHQLDYQLDDEIAADTPARLKAMGDPLRHLLLDLVLERAMSVTELAERVRRPKGSVAHHVDLLVDVGLLQVVRTRKVRSVEERFYGRTARTIMFPDHAHDGDLPFFRDARAVADLDAMAADVPSGFTMRSVRVPDEVAAEFLDRVMNLALEFSRLPRGGEREFAFVVGVFPTTRPVAPATTDTSRRKEASDGS